MRILWIVSDALAGIEEGQGQVVQRALGVLVQQPHHLGGVDDRPTTDGDDGVGLYPVEELDPGVDHRLVGFDRHLGEHSDVARSVEAAAHLLGDATGVHDGIGHDHDLGRAELAQLLERTGTDEDVAAAPGTTGAVSGAGSPP